MVSTSPAGMRRKGRMPEGGHSPKKKNRKKHLLGICDAWVSVSDVDVNVGIVIELLEFECLYVRCSYGR